MKLLTLTIPITMSLPTMNHPLSMGAMLLIQTIVISMSTGMMNSTFWFSYIMFLIMIGGMLIMFIYMTSIASNEKFNFKINNWMTITVSLCMMIIITNLSNYQNMNKTSSLFKFENFNQTMIMNAKYYSPEMKIMMISLMMYLLLTLVMTVKLTKKENGPLRKK